MILLSGTLQKSSLAAQACLRCELGAFMVQDERLASVSAGEYEGLFEIDRIQPQCQSAEDGTMQLGVMASLKRFSLTLLEQPTKTVAKQSRSVSANRAQFSLFIEEENTDSSETESCASSSALEIPSAEELSDENLVSATAESIVQGDMSLVSVSDAEIVAEAQSLLAPDVESVASEVKVFTAADSALFGEHFMLSETITLDATESREVLRQQRDRLKELGYHFDATQQVWRNFLVNETICHGQLTG